MGALEFFRPSASNPTRILTGEDIVRSAEMMGKLQIEREWNGYGYKAQIRFQNHGGSLIWATGIDSDFFTAIKKAVEEAGRLR